MTKAIILPVLVFRMRILLTVAVLYCFLVQAAVADPASSRAQPPVKDLGNGKYRIGAIELDKTNLRFTIPGTILDIADQPLEYIAVTKGGLKAYESLLELQANAYEFNLACILIRLDNKNARLPEFHFDPKPVPGDQVKITIQWMQGEASKSVGAEQIVLEGGKLVESKRWSYTGSTFDPDNRYLAEMAGTLIGFVHDPSSIIEHQDGLGLGQYGEVLANHAILPPPGTAVYLTVEKSSK